MSVSGPLCKTFHRLQLSIRSYQNILGAAFDPFDEMDIKTAKPSQVRQLSIRFSRILTSTLTTGHKKTGRCAEILKFIRASFNRISPIEKIKLIFKCAMSQICASSRAQRVRTLPLTITRFFIFTLCSHGFFASHLRDVRGCLNAVEPNSQQQVGSNLRRN